MRARVWEAALVIGVAWVIMVASLGCVQQANNAPHTGIRIAQAGTPRFDFYENFSLSQTINSYASTAHYNASSKGYDLGGAPPYAGPKNLTSAILAVPNFFIISVTLTVFADLKTDTALTLSVTNNYFYTEVSAVNNTPIALSGYGREIAYKITLSTTNTLLTPTVSAVMLNSTGAYYNATSFSCTEQQYIFRNFHDTQTYGLGSMKFNSDSTPIEYGMSLALQRGTIDANTAWVLGAIQVDAITSQYVASQANYANYDLKITINCVNYRFFGSASFTTSIISTGRIGQFWMFNITVPATTLGIIDCAGTITYSCWNGEGGALVGTTDVSIDVLPYNLNAMPEELFWIIVILCVCVAAIVVIAVVWWRKHHVSMGSLGKKYKHLHL